MRLAVAPTARGLVAHAFRSVRYPMADIVNMTVTKSVSTAREPVESSSCGMRGAAHRERCLLEVNVFPLDFAGLAAPRSGHAQYATEGARRASLVASVKGSCLAS